MGKSRDWGLGIGDRDEDIGMEMEVGVVMKLVMAVVQMGIRLQMGKGTVVQTKGGHGGGSSPSQV